MVKIYDCDKNQIASCVYRYDKDLSVTISFVDTKDENSFVKILYFMIGRLSCQGIKEIYFNLSENVFMKYFREIPHEIFYYSTSESYGGTKNFVCLKINILDVFNEF